MAASYRAAMTQMTLGGAEVKRSGTESSQKQAAAAVTNVIIGDAERSVCSALLMSRFLDSALRASLEMTGGMLRSK